MKPIGKTNKSNNIVVKDVGVDSGTIIVADVSIIEKDYKKEKDNNHIIEISNGTYNVNVTILDSWNGQVSTSGTLKVTSGKIVVTDPCYIIGIEDEKWMDFLRKIYSNWDKCHGRLKKNDNYTKEIGIVIADNMGGDGIYEVSLNVLSGELR
jgi:hypothetical protein